MIHLITGGSGSGKSEYAENWLTGRDKKQEYTKYYPNGRKIREEEPGVNGEEEQKKDDIFVYIATMQPYTEETLKKIERHHRLRAGKGFRTLEKYTDLAEFEIPENQGILLECISNLVANELYRDDGTLNDLKETEEKVLAGVRRLNDSTARLAIVTNEVTADINGYSEETEKYRKCIGRVNQRLAELADIVTEVVYGIPVCVKGTKVCDVFFSVDWCSDRTSVLRSVPFFEMVWHTWRRKSCFIFYYRPDPDPGLCYWWDSSGWLSRYAGCTELLADERTASGNTERFPCRSVCNHFMYSLFSDVYRCVFVSECA